MDSDRTQPAASFWFGLGLILVALFFLGFAGQIERLDVTDENDPGPRAFPLALGFTLLVGGVVQAILGWRQRAAASLAQNEHDPGGSRWDALLLAVALIVYLVAVPQLGFYFPTAVFAALMTWRLGARWWAAGMAAGLLLLVVRVLFVGAFRVQLP